MSSSGSVKYLLDLYPDVTFTKETVEDWRRGIGADGYGKKIKSDYMAQIGPRKHRVYIIQYSNAGTAYVLIRNEMYIVRDYDIPESVKTSRGVPSKQPKKRRF